jgi:Tol biopolymer transport system component/DNA-binding winged helix-turn-helix (wHTH) protein
MIRPARYFYKFGPFRVDPTSRRLLRQGQAVQITPKAFDVLLVLIENSGQVIDKEELMKKVWPDTAVEENNLTRNISSLRKALGESPGEHRYIVTVPGRGYSFVAEIEELSDEAAELVVEEHNLARLASEEQATNLHPMVSASGDLINRPRPKSSRAVIVPVLLVIALASIAFALYRLYSGGRTDNRPAALFQNLQMRRLTSTGNAVTAAISPDSKYVAYAIEEKSKQSLWVRQIATASNVQIVPPDDVSYWGITFSPDSNYIYYVAWPWNKTDASLYQLPVLGDALPRKLIDDVHSISFSPDGKRFTYVVTHSSTGESKLMIANADGTQEQVLALRQHPEFFSDNIDVGPAWSPDGKVIACPGGTYASEDGWMEVSEVRTDDGAQKAITTQGWPSISRLAWLSDMSGLVMTAREQQLMPRQLWHIAYPTGEARRVTNNLSDYSGVSLNAASDLMVSVQTEQINNIWIAPNNSAPRAYQIASETVAMDGMEGMSWMPTDKIVYRSNASGNSEIWTMNSDGTGQTQLTFDPGIDLHPVASPDGRYIIFASNRAGAFNIWRMNTDGRNLLQLTGGAGEARPQCSPDGKWVVYQQNFLRRKYAVGKISIDGGQAVQLTREVSHRPVVSPDGKSVAYFYMDANIWGIAVIPFESGQTARRFNIPQTARSRIVRWTPDGRALAYIVTSQGASNIWSQPLGGGEPVPLTDFKSDQMFFFDWSRDGKYLACVRGTRASDIVLLSNFN